MYACISICMFPLFFSFPDRRTGNHRSRCITSTYTTIEIQDILQEGVVSHPSSANPRVSCFQKKLAKLQARRDRDDRWRMICRKLTQRCVCTTCFVDLFYHSQKQKEEKKNVSRFIGCQNSKTDRQPTVPVGVIATIGTSIPIGSFRGDMRKNE